LFGKYSSRKKKKLPGISVSNKTTSVVEVDDDNGWTKLWTDVPIVQFAAVECEGEMQ